MAYTVLFALAGAFVFSLTVVPVLTSYLVRPEHGPERETLAAARGSREAVPPALRRGAEGGAWLTIGGAVPGAGAARRGGAVGRLGASSCRSSTRATCWSRRGACPAQPWRSWQGLQPTAGLDLQVMLPTARRTSALPMALDEQPSIAHSGQPRLEGELAQKSPVPIGPQAMQSISSHPDAHQ